MASPRGRVLSGARIADLLNGQRVGWATNIEVREQWDLQPVRVLDEIEVIAHEPAGYTASVNMGTLTLVDESMKSAGFMPVAGRERGSRLRNALTLDELTLTCNDYDGEVLWVVLGVKIATQNFSVQAGALSATRVDALARSVLEAHEL